MAYGLIANIGVQRNEDWLRELRLKVGDDAVDLTGWGYSFRVNRPAGLSGAPLLTFGVTASDNGSMIRAVEPTGGAFSLLIKQEDIDALPGRKQDLAVFPYNLLLTDASSVVRALMSGALVVEPMVGAADSSASRFLQSEGGAFLVTEDGSALVGDIR